jgi:hypothetical protein
MALAHVVDESGHQIAPHRRIGMRRIALPVEQLLVGGTQRRRGPAQLDKGRMPLASKAS